MEPTPWGLLQTFILPLYVSMDGALEALRNALYKFKTYLLTYLLFLVILKPMVQVSIGEGQKLDPLVVVSAQYQTVKSLVSSLSIHKKVVKIHPQLFVFLLYTNNHK